jgi:hypothetical protein
VRPTITAVAAGLALAAAMTATTASPAIAASGDVGNVAFAAPLHDSYDHATGGGVYGDGSNTYVRGELLGENFECGDRATFLAAIDTAAAPVAVSPFAVEVTMSFTTDTTGQSGAALFPIVDSPMVNVGDPALVPAEPTAYVDGEATVVASGDPYTNGAFEQIVFTVAGLEPSQTVVVRVDARIACPYLPIGDTPTGNLQATLQSVFVLDPPNPPADSGTGRQTVNLRRVQNFTNIGEAALVVTKTAVADGQECPGSDQVTVPLGIAVDYCYAVENLGSGPAIDLVLVDDMATPDDTSDDVTLALDGLSDEDGDQVADDLGEGTATAILTDVTYAELGSYTNVATASESAFSITASAEATVTTEDVLGITKSRTGTGTPGLGDTIRYQIVATNTSAVLSLDDVTITDGNATIGTCTPAMPATLAPGETLTCSATHPVTMADADAGSVSNTAEVTASFLGHPLGGPSNEVVVPVAAPPIPELSLVKTRIGDTPVTVGDTITYRITATNDSEQLVLDDIVIVDSNATITSCTPEMPATLAPGESLTCTAVRVVTAADAAAGEITNVASVEGYSAETDVTLADVASNPVVVTIPQLTELPATGNGRLIAGTALLVIAFGGGLWLLASRRRHPA